MSANFSFSFFFVQNIMNFSTKAILVFIIFISSPGSPFSLVFGKLPNWTTKKPSQSTKSNIRREPTEGWNCGDKFLFYPGDLQILSLPIPFASENATKLYCAAHFLGAKGCKPIIKCPYFALPKNTCSTNYVIVNDRMAGEQKFCGDKGPWLTSTGTSILHFALKLDLTPTEAMAIYGNSQGGFLCDVTCQGAEENVQIIPNAKAPPKTLECKCGIPRAGVRELDAMRGLTRKKRARGSQNLFDWHVIITDFKRNMTCDGALISNQYVLTSGHCAQDIKVNSFHIILNFFDLKNTSGAILRNVTGVVSHPFFSKEQDADGFYDFDIALLQIEPIDLVPRQRGKQPTTLSPICLPPRGATNQYTKSTVVFTGFGLRTDDVYATTKMRDGRGRAIPDDMCKTEYGVYMTSRMMCYVPTLAHPQELCIGAWGGPVYVAEKGGAGGFRYVLIGTISYGPEECPLAPEGVFVSSRLTELNDWIRQIAFDSSWCQE